MNVIALRLSALTAALIAAALVAPGCVFFRSAEAPMPVVEHRAAAAVAAPAAPAASSATARPLAVLLPGFGDGPEDFDEHGFVTELRARGFDVAATDAHFGYYRGFTVVDRLRQDVIAPARARGVTEIWLVGISMGGFGAVSYATLYPDEVTGAVLLAPYLGDGDIPDEVRAAGGLAAWQPGDLDAVDDAEERHTRKVWAFLKSYGAGQGDKPQLILGWGKDDRIGRAAALVAAVLPAEQVLVRPGGHKWVTWRPLFSDLAERFLSTAARAAGQHAAR